MKLKASAVSLKELIRLFESSEEHIVGVKQVPKEDISKYGIIDAIPLHNRTYVVRDLIEKPPIDQATSNVAIMGRYILKPSIFEALKQIERGAGNEYQLTDALRKVCRKEGLLAMQLIGERYDIGNKFGYIKAIIEMGLQRTELQPRLLELLKSIVGSEGDHAPVQQKIG